MTGTTDTMTGTDMMTTEARTIIDKAMTNQGPLESWQRGGDVIQATLKMIVRPEKRSALLESMRGMLQPARVERGCLSYHLYEDVENRNAFVLLEAWASQEDLERHLAKDNQRQLLSLMDLLSAEPELRFNTVSHTAGMDLIERVLKAGGSG